MDTQRGIFIRLKVVPFQDGDIQNKGDFMSCKREREAKLSFSYLKSSFKICNYCEAYSIRVAKKGRSVLIVGMCRKENRFLPKPCTCERSTFLYITMREFGPPSGA